MMTNSLLQGGLAERHRKGRRKPRARRGPVVGKSAARSVEVRLRGFGILRHFRVHDLAERVRIQRHAAIVAVLRLEAARMAADVGHAGLFQERDDFLERTARRFGASDLYIWLAPLHPGEQPSAWHSNWCSPPLARYTQLQGSRWRRSIRLMFQPFDTPEDLVNHGSERLSKYFCS